MILNASAIYELNSIINWRNYSSNNVILALPYEFWN